MNTPPSAAVVSSQSLQRSISPRVIDDTASTIVSELISSTNELTDVNGMSNSSAAASGSSSDSGLRLRSSR